MNSKLKDRVFTVPENVLAKIRHTMSGLGDQSVVGKDRAQNILSQKTVTYGQLKRIIHDLKSMDKVNERVRYDLYGGDLMEKWANTFLNGERDLIRDKKDASANINNNTGVERKNPFLKKHTKKPQGINLGIKSNSEKSVVSPLTSLKLFEEIKRFKDIINY
jgi:hypothetical protein